jgi:hypothetical protein
MALISVTRLRLRSLRFLPAFAWHTWASTRQARRAPEFLGGQLAREGARTFWTLTAWTDEAAMRRYRGADAHLRAMPRLLHWCDEASVVHWRQDGPDLPDGAAALRRMVAEGRPSKVLHPSPEHAAGRIAPAGQAPRPGLRFRPVDHRS